MFDKSTHFDTPIVLSPPLTISIDDELIKRIEKLEEIVSMQTSLMAQLMGCIKKTCDHVTAESNENS